LGNEAIKNLENKIQSQGVTASIENLAQKILEVLDSLAPQDKNNGQEDKGPLSTLRDSLEKELVTFTLNSGTSQRSEKRNSCPRGFTD
jgi:hypothetical protein